MTNLLALALLTLFTPFKINTGLVQIRPFDGLVVLMFLLTLLSQNTHLRRQLPAGFLILLPYFFWHIWSATSVNLENGLREGLQIGIITLFALTLILQSDRIDYAKLGQLMLIGILLITAYNIYWHVDHGFWSGWKRLIDPKRAFSFLPLVLGCFLLFMPRSRRQRYWLLWLLVGLVILYSGERKALLIYLVLFAALAARGRVIAALPVLVIGVAGLAFFESLTSDPYLARQMDSILDPFGSELSLSEIAHGAIPDSISNAQRAFALQLSFDLFQKHPVAGVGTNAYYDIVLTRFAYLPDFMRLSPHGEFLRILAENGLIGLSLYLIIWVSAFIRVRQTLTRFVRQSVLTRNKAMVLQVVLIFPAFAYVAFEAPGTHSLVILSMISLLSVMVERALTQAVAKGIRVPAPRHRNLPPGQSGACRQPAPRRPAGSFQR